MQQPGIPNRAKVSIAERIMPALALAATALAGGVGAILIRSMFTSLRDSFNAGLAGLLTASAQIELTIGSILSFAAFLGIASMIVSVYRMFGVSTRSTPPGLLFPVLAAFSFIPPAVTAYSLWLAMSAVLSPQGEGIPEVGALISILNYVAIGAAAFSLLLLAVFAFVPFSSRSGRKFSPIIFLILIELGIVGFAAIFFWAAYNSYVIASENA